MSARGWIDCRAVFARRVRALAGDGDERWRDTLIVPDEAPVDGLPPTPPTRRPSATLVVPGLLGLSLRSLVAPLLCARDALRPQGYRVDVAWVSGRGNASSNGRRLRERVLETADANGAPIIVVGYSKGCTDALHMLGEHADTHEAVHALVSLGGVVWGTPLAAMTPRWLRLALRYAPIPGEPRGDADTLEDLTRERRAAWLREHPLPASIRYASIVATPAPGNVSRVLRGSYRRLAEIDASNDSQVIMEDAILPDSELLATVDADHWALALPITERHPWLARAFVDRNAFPRGLLLQALIDHLDSG